MNKSSEQSKGFTLVELLVYMSVVVLAVTVFMNFVIEVTKHATVAEAKQEIQQSARFLLSRMSQNIRTAASIDSGNSSFDIDQGKLTLLQNGGAESFYLQDNVVYYDDASGPVSLTGDKVRVTRLRFQQADDTIFINLAMERDSSTMTEQTELSSTIVPRAAIY